MASATRPEENPPVTWEAPPPLPPRKGTKRPSKYLDVIRWAMEGFGRKGIMAETIGDEQVQVGPWARYPSDRKPIVGYEVLKGLNDAFGPESDYRTEEGHYFEILLREKEEMPTSSRKRGVLWVRKVVPA